MTNRAKHIIQYAETVETFTATQYVTTLNADVSLHSIVNILNRMVRQGRLQRLKRGVYTLARHNMWKVVLGDLEKTVYNLIHNYFPLIK